MQKIWKVVKCLFQSRFKPDMVAHLVKYTSGTSVSEIARRNQWQIYRNACVEIPAGRISRFAPYVQDILSVSDHLRFSVNSCRMYTTSSTGWFVIMTTMLLIWYCYLLLEWRVNSQVSFRINKSSGHVCVQALTVAFGSMYLLGLILILLQLSLLSAWICIYQAPYVKSQIFTLFIHTHTIMTTNIYMSYMDACSSLPKCCTICNLSSTAKPSLLSNYTPNLIITSVEGREEFDWRPVDNTTGLSISLFVCSGLLHLYLCTHFICARAKTNIHVQKWHLEANVYSNIKKITKQAHRLQCP